MDASEPVPRVKDLGEGKDELLGDIESRNISRTKNVYERERAFPLISQRTRSQPWPVDPVLELVGCV
jgi:hypothetical protein